MAEQTKNKNFGDLFEFSLKDLITAYNPYCILWAELEPSFKQKKGKLSPDITQFESGYGNTIEHFLENISMHLSDMWAITNSLQKNTNQDINTTDYEALARVSDQLRIFANKIMVLREFNADRHRAMNQSKGSKKSKKKFFGRISLRW